MEYRRLGKSDLQVSVVTFGAWAAGGWMWGGRERKDPGNLRNWYWQKYNANIVTFQMPNSINNE